MEYSRSGRDLLEARLNDFFDRKVIYLKDIIEGMDDEQKLNSILCLNDMTDEGVLKTVYRVQKNDVIIDINYNEPTDIPDVIHWNGQDINIKDTDLITGFLKCYVKE